MAAKSNNRFTGQDCRQGLSQQCWQQVQSMQVLLDNARARLHLTVSSLEQSNLLTVSGHSHLASAIKGAIDDWQIRQTNVITGHQPDLQPVFFHLKAGSDCLLPVPAEVLHVFILALLRQFSPVKSPIRIVLDGSQLHFTGLMLESGLSQRSARIAPSAFVRRVCQHYAWQYSIAQEQGSTKITICW